MSDPSAVPVSKSKPVLIMTSVLAAVQVILGGGVLTSVLDPKVYGLLALVFAAVQVGWGVYTTGQVTPWVDVVAKAAGGRVVAGPAARQLTGSPVVVSNASGRVVAPPVDPKRGEQGAVSLWVLGWVITVIGVFAWLFTVYDVLALCAIATGLVLVAIHLAITHRAGGPTIR